MKRTGFNFELEFNVRTQTYKRTLGSTCKRQVMYLRYLAPSISEMVEVSPIPSPERADSVELMNPQYPAYTRLRSFEHELKRSDSVLDTYD